MKLQSVLRLKPLALTTVLSSTGLTLAALVIPVQSAHAQTLEGFDVQAGPLAGALTALASKAGVVLAFNPALLQGRVTEGVKSVTDVEAGLQQLLQGTGYAVRKTGFVAQIATTTPVD